ncbi:MAG TPA: amino acid permease [Spirochaetota bacterium]|nr:amino acid permease [Spirochaetota bacterium]HRX49556.1 amino acid permease [Spirochaetota bacterium]
MKFGTFKGVFVPSTEAILGTVLFLLLPALVGDLGLIPMLGIIMLAHSVTLATSFSLSDCATNLTNIEGGGMYALSKKSLGKALGGSIGIQLYLAQAASIGFYCIGFAEPLQPVISGLFQSSPLIPDFLNDNILTQKQVIASIIFLLFFIFAFIGADFTLKIQMFILIVLFVSIATIFLSPLLNIDFNGNGLFVTSFSNINLTGTRTVTVAIFFIAFTQFFPAVTGLDAGIGMSGDLKDPKHSIVTGTFWAIGVTFCVYIASTVLFSLMKQEILVTGYAGQSPQGNILTDILGFQKPFPDNIAGLLVLTGILVATSSSALSCFMTAPRTLQALSKDDILPHFLFFLGKDIRKNGEEPRYATLFTCFIGMSIIWMGSINIAATIVGICFLVVYGWVNGSAFLERISGNPSFRPASGGHLLIPLYGFLSSIISILLFSPVTGLLIIIVQYNIFRLLLKYKTAGKLEGVWWGVLFSIITSALKALNRIIMDTKNWRPIMTAISFTGTENNHAKIAYIASMIASHKGIVVLNILKADKNNNSSPLIENLPVPAGIISTNETTQSILSIIQQPFAGGLQSNTVLLEFSTKVDNVKVIKKILELDKNILLLKNGARLNKMEQIDIWWRGEKNGNLMVLLAYIMISTHKEKSHENCRIRIIRKLNENESMDTAAEELTDLLDKSRVIGEPVILPFSKEPFEENLFNVSLNADLIMMGMPGNYIEKENSRFFILKEFFFDKEITKYSDMPAILFVKSVHVINLQEE